MMREWNTTLCKEALVMHPSLSWNHLSRARQLLLVVLWGLAGCVVLLTLLYLAVPGTPVAATAVNPPRDTNQTPPPLVPQMAGQFQLRQGHAMLTLRQYDNAITGTLTVQTCANGHAHLTAYIVTGQALADGTLRLTFSAPNQAHSQTFTYLVAPQPDGFTWQWRDAKGHLQLQRWQLATGALGVCAPAATPTGVPTSG
jgi:hypothetical protein